MAGGTFLGNDNVAIFGPLRFWAERGLLHCEDSRDNSYETLSVRTALQRARAISDMLGNSSKRDMHSEDQFDRANRARHLRFLEQLMALVEKAKIQGMPSDASARRDLVNRRPKTFVVPAVNHQM
jgi:hypothetical protein